MVKKNAMIKKISLGIILSNFLCRKKTIFPTLKLRDILINEILMT